MKNIFKCAGILVLILALGTAVSSCGFGSKKTGEKLLEKAIEKETGENADVDISGEKAVIETDKGRLEFDPDNASWPGEIPDEIPEFKYGKITGVITSSMEEGDSWNVIFEEVEEGYIDKYNAELKQKGFETTFMKIGEQGGSITVDNDNYTIFLMGGDGKASVGVTVKKQQ